MTKLSKNRQPDATAVINNGLAVLNGERPRTAERTLVVLGVARSGTTMVAGTLHHLGIFVTDKPNAVFEDVPLAQATEARDWPALKALIAARNAAHPVWAWKRPSLIDHIGQVGEYLRNPEYVVIFRDIFAIANRNRISVFSDLTANMRRSLTEYQALVDFTARCKSRALLVSYEKAMEDPLRFIQGLADFAGVTDPALLARARPFIQREPETYLKTSRLVRGIGGLGRVGYTVITGWAYVDGQERPANVVIRVNGRELTTLVANRERADVKAKGLHPTGACGFRLDLPLRQRLHDGDAVSARVVGDIRDLKGSPRKVAVADVRADGTEGDAEDREADGA